MVVWASLKTPLKPDCIKQPSACLMRFFGEVFDRTPTAQEALREGSALLYHPG